MTFYNTFANFKFDNISCGSNPFSPQNSCVSTNFNTAFIPSTPFVSPFSFGSLTMPSVMPASIFTSPAGGGFSFMNFMPSLPVFNFVMPSINFNFPMIDTRNMDFSNAGFDTFTRTSGNNIQKAGASRITTDNASIQSSNVKLTGSLADYNATAGEKLASTAMENRQYDSWKSVPKGKGRCAHFVSNALEKSGMSNGKRGDGYQMANILRQNSHFKEISPNSVNVDNLPAGCVLVYNKGSQRYSPLYGHTEITTGNGKAVSQAITNDLRKPDAIFIPV